MSSVMESRNNGDAAVPAVIHQLSAELVESVLVKGDLARLTPAERLKYYQAVCASLHLNPLTRPFEYLTLNGRMVLYAKRECTEQLRRIHGVSTRIVSREVIDGDTYVVTVRATDKTGREDESTGVVAIGGLKGDQKASALMRAETKGKRRVTLSLCGLAFLDEAELDIVPAARMAPVVDTLEPERGAREVKPAGRRKGPAPPPPQLPADAEEPWDNFKNMIVAFSKLHGRLPPGHDHVYGETLNRFGAKHANGFTDRRTAVAAYRALEAKVLELEAAGATIAVEAGEPHRDELGQEGDLFGPEELPNAG